MSAEETRYKQLENDVANATVVKMSANRHNMKAPDNLNGRFTAGQVIGGVKLKRDNRDITGMVASIKSADGIMEPLVCWENERGEYEVRRGFRRFNASNVICLTEPGSELAHKLSELPILLYSGISREASMLLINDQTSQPFAASEVYQMFGREIKGGANWKVLCRQWFPQLGRISGSADKVAEVNRETDPAKRDKLVDDWMNNFGNQYWGNSIKAGPWVENIVLMGYLEDDGLLEPVAEGEPKRPRLNSKSMKAMWKAYNEDQKAGEFDRVKGYGPRMVECLTEANKVKEKPVNPPRNRKSSEDLESLININSANNRKLVPAILGMAFVGGTAADEVNAVNGFEDNATLFVKHREFLTDEFREIFQTALFGPPAKFEELLLSKYAKVKSEPRIAIPVSVVNTPEAEVVPAVEAAPEPTPEPEPESKPGKKRSK